MDNHKAALWCWFQHIPENKLINLIHIDKHTDSKKVHDKCIEVCPDLWSVNIEEYLLCKYDKFPLFDWGNYITIFLSKYKRIIDKCIFATHNDGDKPNFDIQIADIWDVPCELNYWIEKSENKTILNIDLDYFFYGCDSGNGTILFSDEYIEQTFSSIKKQLEAKKILCFTMSLSPECCGGWFAAEEMCYKIIKYLELDFKLPILR